MKIRPMGIDLYSSLVRFYFLARAFQKANQSNQPTLTHTIITQLNPFRPRKRQSGAIFCVPSLTLTASSNKST